MRPISPEARETNRANPADWIMAAARLLASEGINAVRIERLARTLKKTRGSFYWHFRNREDLLLRILEDWRQTSTLAIIERLEASPLPPVERLRSLLAIAFTRTDTDKVPAMEFAIRQWGRTDARAHRALQEVDRLRVRYFMKLFEELGFAAEPSRIRALLANSFMRVGPSLPDQRGLDDLDAAIQVLSQA